MVHKWFYCSFIFLICIHTPLRYHYAVDNVFEGKLPLSSNLKQVYLRQIDRYHITRLWEFVSVVDVERVMVLLHDDMISNISHLTPHFTPRN